MSRPKGSSTYGRYSKLTSEQIAEIRCIYATYKTQWIRRTQLCNELGITKQYFCNVGRGVAGKKPRATA